MNSSDAPSPARKLRTFVLAVFLSGLALGTASYACVPASQRLATPIACPTGTVDSAVVTHVTRNNRGSIVTEFDFRCLDADGGSTAPSGFAVLGTLALYGMAVALVVALLALVRRKAGASVAAAAMLTLSGCELGTLTRDEFAAIHPYGTGPMFSTGRASEGARALAARLGHELRVTSVTIAPDFASFTVVAPGTRDDCDVYTVREDGIGDPSPIQTSEREATEDLSFVLTPAMLAKVTSIVHDAPARIGIADAHVRSISLCRGGGEPEWHVDVESRHRRGSARFDVNGALVHVDPD